MIKIDIDTTEANKALDALQARIKETQTMLEELNASMVKLEAVGHSEKLIGRLRNKLEKRVWVTEFEALRSDEQTRSDSAIGADKAVLAYRFRTRAK